MHCGKVASNMNYYSNKHGLLEKILILVILLNSHLNLILNWKSHSCTCLVKSCRIWGSCSGLPGIIIHMTELLEKSFMSYVQMPSAKTIYHIISKHPVAFIYTSYTLKYSVFNATLLMSISFCTTLRHVSAPLAHHQVSCCQSCLTVT
jgi:hypothetical protein